MGFFRWMSGGTPDEQNARADMQRKIQETREAELIRQEYDLQLLAAGGIPSEAKKRLEELGRTAGDTNAIFTSNLSPDELALLRRHGYRPRGLVTGSAVWQVGAAYASTYDCEVQELTLAYDQATALAVSRLKQERDLLGAHGVVGVRFSMVRHEWSENLVEVQLIGTAIEAPEMPMYGPFLSDLSGQEWWALHSSGFDSVDIVWGYCAWFIYTSLSDEQILRGWNNTEIWHWSEGLAMARNRALMHLDSRAREADCDGVTGVKIDRRIQLARLSGTGENSAYEREHHNLLLSIIGTTIRERLDHSIKQRRTYPVLSLRDGKIKGMTKVAD